MMNIRNHLTIIAKTHHIAAEILHLPDCDLDPEGIKVVMISEVPPHNPDDGFYSSAGQPDYMKTTLGLFEKASVDVKSMLIFCKQSRQSALAAHFRRYGAQIQLRLFFLPDKLP